MILQTKDMNCGPVAIYNYFTAHGINLDMDFLEELSLFDPEEGTELYDLHTALLMLGADVACYEDGSVMNYDPRNYYVLRVEIEPMFEYHLYLYHNGKAYNFSDDGLVQRRSFKSVRIQGYRHNIDGYIEIRGY